MELKVSQALPVKPIKSRMGRGIMTGHRANFKDQKSCGERIGTLNFYIQIAQLGAKQQKSAGCVNERKSVNSSWKRLCKKIQKTEAKS